MLKLVLVSESPRRKQILEEAGFLFSTNTVKISEIVEENVNVESAIMSIARQKGEAYVRSNNHLKSQDILALSADTMVVFNNRALGKPQNTLEAKRYLRLLSGQEHRVITAIYLQNLKSGENFLGYDSTKVLFKDLTDSEIDDYVTTGEPMDKAGAYAIQGIGAQFVKDVMGSFKNVVGLPIELFENVLAEKGWHVARK